MASLLIDNAVNRGLFTKTIYTFATLPPAANNQGCEQLISDATTNPATTSGQVAVGGGTTLTRVISDGTVWRIYGWS